MTVTILVSILARPVGRALLGAPINMQQMPSFNPRPPRGASATFVAFLFVRCHLVSILARPVGRALLGDVRSARTTQPVSILARPVGRALRFCHQGWSGQRQFQSSPAPWGERYPVSGMSLAAPSRFQSSPAPWGERYFSFLNCLLSMLPFQSSPAPWGERYVGRGGLFPGGIRFNPRPPRGASATNGANSGSRCANWFQSSPAPWGERYDFEAVAAQCTPPVSILARPVGRALLKLGDGDSANFGVSILARPVGRALPR